MLDDWRYRRPGVATELRDYKVNLLHLLNQEFGIDWRDEGDHTDPSALARRMLASYAHLVGPLEGLLEYRFRPGEREAYVKHRGGIAVATDDVRRRWVAMFRDLLILRCPDAAERTTSWSRLRDLGLGEPVDELDFL